MLAGFVRAWQHIFNVDVVLVRVAFVLLVILTHGFGVLIYIILAIVIPAPKLRPKSAAYGERLPR